MSNSNPNSTSHATSTSSTTVKLLLQNPSFQPFSGEDVTYSALTFLEACEDSMRNLYITSDTDKIAYLRSNLKSNSVASTMMHSSAFTPKLINCSYSTFRANFLTAFGLTQHHDSLRWVFRHADSLTTQLGTSNYLVGQALDSSFANEVIDALYKASWLIDDALPVGRLLSILKFSHNIQYLPPNERRTASSTDFKPDDSLLDFGAKIAKQLRQVLNLLFAPPRPQ